MERRVEIRTVPLDVRLAGYADCNVSAASPVQPEDVNLPILECDQDGNWVDIVDGFHRIAGFAAAGVDEFRAICCTADGDDDLVAAAAIPGGYGGMKQADAIAELTRMAGDLEHDGDLET